MARRLAQEGLRVAVNYRGRADAAQATVEAIRRAGGQAEAFAADVGQAEQVDALFAAVAERFGAVEVLVNNAGITRDNLLLRLAPDDWAKVLETDLTSVYLCCRAAVKGMLRRRFGRIVNISSIAGISGNAGQVNYAAAKAGILGLTRSLAKEVGSRNITVNAVAPGLIDTEMTQDLPDAQRQALLPHIPLGRFGRPDEVAEAVWFLVHAEYVTGQTLVVDGGLLTV